MSTINMITLPLTDALCNPNQKTAYLRSHTVHWMEPEEDCFFLQYSYNQKDWYALNGGNPIQLPAHGLTVCTEFSQHSPTGIEIDLDLLHGLHSLYGAPEPVYLHKLEDISASGSKKNCPQEITVEYTNGMQEKRPVKWEGTTGHIQTPNYPTPLIMHRADPYIYKHTDGSYYFMGSYTDSKHNLDGPYQYLYLILRKSATIAGLADGSGEYQEQIIWERAPIHNGTMSPHLWAPEIHFIHGKWYVYYTTTISEESPWKIRPHCLECTGDNPMKDPWINRGPMQTTIENDIAFTDFSLDHTYFHHNGKDYLVWPQKTNNISDLYIAQLENPWTICTPAIRLSRPNYNWEQHGFHVEEGPSILKHDEKIYIVFSSSGTDATYCMGYLCANADSELLEASSWTKCPYPVFQSSAANSCYGPGHNSFTKSEDDKEDLFIYHGRKDARYLGDDDYQPLYDAGRNAYVGKVFWNPDGTPNFSVPGAPLASDPNDLVL